METAMHNLKKARRQGQMIEMVGEMGVEWTRRLLKEARIPKEWRMGLIVPIWKRKRDVHDPGMYRGITQLS